ncbi:MAG: hypothetical protein K2H13_04905 [Eubacterium sp.]|nr:hypothetical protein [Eubacterium sp.]MDE6156215.1 hypothetical protein [Eubacterium sp.]
MTRILDDVDFEMNNENTTYEVVSHFNSEAWIIDEDAAETVRYIFQPCICGLVPTQMPKD